jgi:hypothetical protein
MKRIKTSGNPDSRGSFHNVKEFKCPEKYLKELKQEGCDYEERHLFERGYNRAVKDLDESEEYREQTKENKTLYHEQLKRYKGKKMLHDTKRKTVSLKSRKDFKTNEEQIENEYGELLKENEIKGTELPQKQEQLLFEYQKEIDDINKKEKELKKTNNALKSIHKSELNEEQIENEYNELLKDNETEGYKLSNKRKQLAVAYKKERDNIKIEVDKLKEMDYKQRLKNQKIRNPTKRQFQKFYNGLTEKEKYEIDKYGSIQ